MQKKHLEGQHRDDDSSVKMMVLQILLNQAAIFCDDSMQKVITTAPLQPAIQHVMISVRAKRVTTLGEQATCAESRPGTRLGWRNQTEKEEPKERREIEELEDKIP
ncbi:hypothetical protein J6590_007767 [Homalodisca vitripennis]|nr:hypothetical protein J6590_007767 [Homalodisca vitripennis]